MNYIPSRERTFFYRIDISTFYATYLRWFRHISERLGTENTLLVWRNTFADYDDEHLLGILSSEWYQVEPNESNRVADKISSLVDEIILTTNLELSESEVQRILENTPPIYQIKHYFANDIMEREISAYDALHIRFDGLACLAETIIESYGKQGELIVYDLMIEGRLESSRDEKGSVEQFIAYFTAEPDQPDIFTAGLETRVIHATESEAVINVLECEWGRYFRERHPQVGYLMACSTDEIAYKSFNNRLRMQRTQTIMEGDELCDFWIYAVNG